MHPTAAPRLSHLDPHVSPQEFINTPPTPDRDSGAGCPGRTATLRTWPTSCGPLQDCNPQNMANILWAFATLDVQPGTALLEAGAHRMLELLPTTKPQALSNTMWAFATLGYNPGMPCPSSYTNVSVQHHVGIRHPGLQPRHAVPTVVCQSWWGMSHAEMLSTVPPGCCRLLKPQVLAAGVIAVGLDVARSLAAECSRSWAEA